MSSKKKNAKENARKKKEEKARRKKEEEERAAAEAAAAVAAEEREENNRVGDGMERKDPESQLPDSCFYAVRCIFGSKAIEPLWKIHCIIRMRL